MAGNIEPQMKRCTTCGGEYLVAFFRPRAHTKEVSSSTVKEEQRYNPRCVGCEASLKDKRRIEGQLRKKAMATRRRHGVRLEKQNVIKDRNDLEALHGWSIEKMIKDIKRVIIQGCPYCLLPLNNPEQGYGIVTLDILNPSLDPHYSTNVRWCCARCNSEKQRTSPVLWGAKRSMWERWHQHQVLLEADPEKYGFLALNKEAELAPTLW